MGAKAFVFLNNISFSHVCSVIYLHTAVSLRAWGSDGKTTCILNLGGG